MPEFKEKMAEVAGRIYDKGGGYLIKIFAGFTFIVYDCITALLADLPRQRKSIISYKRSSDVGRLPNRPAAGTKTLTSHKRGGCKKS